MNKIGVCGHLGKGKNLVNGQTIKTKTLVEELQNILGKENVDTVDSHMWKKNFLQLIIGILNIMRKDKNIIILPAQNGVKVFVPLFTMLNLVYKRNIHYVVIGGWLPELIEANKWMVSFLKRLKGIYVETYSMKQSLEKLGIKNVRYMPNFKKLNIISKENLVYSHTEPYKLCTFSRVMEEKGIGVAIEMVEAVNKKLGRQAYTLDIYGPIDKDYAERFEEIMSSASSAIFYKGIADFNQSVDILKHYFALLFPTYYQGEGFAGTLLDSFSAGVPIISTNWKYNKEIIHDNKDGFIYDYRNPIELKEILVRLIKEPNKIIDMKTNCLKRAEEYLPHKVMKDFMQYI